MLEIGANAEKNKLRKGYFVYKSVFLSVSCALTMVVCCLAYWSNFFVVSYFVYIQFRGEKFFSTRCSMIVIRDSV